MLTPVKITPGEESANKPLPDGAEVTINGDRGLLSKNTIPDQKPWRVSWFSDEDGGICGHIDISLKDAVSLFSGVEVDVVTEDVEYHLTPTGNAFVVDNSYDTNSVQMAAM